MAGHGTRSSSRAQKESSTDKNGTTEDNDSEYKTRITDAILEGDADKLEKIIQEGGLVKLDSRFAPKYHPLSLAAEKGHSRCVKVLLKSGHPPDAFDGSYQPTLISAIQKDNVNLEVVKELLSGGCQVNSPDDFGRSALYYAIEADKLPVIRLLVEHGAHLDKPFDFCDFTPGMLISSRQCLQILLDKGVAQSYNDALGRNILMCLVVSTANKPELAKECIPLVIAAGVSVNAKNRRGVNALMYASECKNEPALQMLMEAGADLSAENDEEGGPTCPLFSALASKDEKAVRLLLNSCADDVLKQWQNEKKTKVVQIAVYQDNVKAIKLLLKKGWPLIRSKKLGGDSMLHDTAGLAWEPCKISFNHILDLWLNENMPLNVHEHYTCTPAFMACKVSKINQLKALMMHGADPTIPHQDGTETLTALLQRSIFRCSPADWYPYWMWPIPDMNTEPLLREKPTPPLAETIKCLRILLDYGYDHLQLATIAPAMLKNAAAHSRKWSPDPAVNEVDEGMCKGARDMFLIMMRVLYLSYHGNKYTGFYNPLEQSLSSMAADHPFQKYPLDIGEFSGLCPLKQLGRDAVRRLLPKPLTQHIDELDLPCLVKDYLKLSDVKDQLKGLSKYYKIGRGEHIRHY